MKTTTLRILFTLAILAGLAAAPNAQTFHWQAGRQVDEVAVKERAQREVERSIARAQRSAELAARMAVRRSTIVSRSYHSRSFNYAANAGAQVGSNEDPCRDGGRYSDDDYKRVCEVRESTMPAGALNVDAGQNGGIVVEAWDGNTIRVRAVVQANASSDERARQLASQVQVQASGGRVYATGPSTDRREWWSVSYRINVPAKNDLDLHANNGGITIVGVNGTMRFDTTNGGVKLQDIGGRVNGETRNGGLNVTLNGNRWDGDGLDVETSNGGVTLNLPEDYNAELETRTVNGGIRIDFPITVQGELTSRKGINTTLGAGGPPVRVRTTNGGVKIGRR
jgi:hypothetical protein